MIHARPGRAARHDAPALTRLAALAPLDAAALTALEAALAPAHCAVVPQRREIVAEGRRMPEPRLIARGWAARVRLLPDGRRQFLSFLLPGDIVGAGLHADPVATATVVALIPVALATAPSIERWPTLAEAYARSAALDEAYLFDQIARLGRLTAQERITSLLVELHERLSLAGLVHGDAFDLPLTQDMLADALGLTAVHVNRMIQQVRRSGAVDWRGGRVRLLDAAALSRSLGRRPTRVSTGG